MTLLYPWVLAFLIPTLLLALYQKRGSKEKKHPFHPKIVITKHSHFEHLLPAVLALLVIAMARPVLKYKIPQKEEMTPIFVAIDFSDSMLAQDFKPDRLTRAKEIAKDIIDHGNTKVALIIFTANPLMIAPPTSDRRMLKIALNSIDKRAILTHSTNFEALLRYVAKFGKETNLAIISDGGDFQDPYKLAKIAKNSKIFAIGVGSSSGALIPKGDGYLKKDGHLVVTKLNPHFQELSTLTKGAFFDTSNYLDLFKHIKKDKRFEENYRFVELYPYVLLLAILLYLFIYTTIFDRFKKWLPLVVVLHLHAGLLDEWHIRKGYEAYQQKRFQEAAKEFSQANFLESRYALALSLIQLGKYDEAIKILRSIKTKDARIKAKIYLAMGFAYEKVHKYDSAREAYIKSLQLYPDKKVFDYLQRVIFKHDEKKPPPPFAKQKMTKAKPQSKEKKGSAKGGGASNINIAQSASNTQKGKRKKSRRGGIARSNQIPISSSVYELINKGYLHEKNPW